MCPRKVLPMEKTPSLSVVLSARNHMNFLRGCLEGILTQTYTDFEFLIVDDGSTDDTWACLETYAQKDPRIRLFRNEHPLGVIKSYNQLFRLTQGSHIWSVATDDHCINRHFLDGGFRLLHRFPHAAGFYANMRIVKMPGEVFERNWATESRDRFFKPSEIMNLFWNDSGYPSGPSLVLKKNWYTLFNGWNHDLGPQCDYFLNILAGGTSGMVYLHRPSVTHRIWPAGDSFLSSQNEKGLIINLAKLERLLKSHLPKWTLQPNRWDRWRTQALFRVINFTHSLRQARKRGEKQMVTTDLKKLYRNLYKVVDLFNSVHEKGPEIGSKQNARTAWQEGLKNYQWRLFGRFISSIRKRFFGFKGNKDHSSIL